MMKHFLMAMVFVAVFMATSTHAANGKKYFADNAGLSITDDLGFPGFNLSFSPGYNEGDALGYAKGRFRVGSVEVDEANGIASLVDGEIDIGTFGLSDEEVSGYQLRVELGFDVSPTTALTAEYRFLEIADSGAPNPHGFVIGARFKF
jgi:opacity protein-like surface antigen